MGLEQPPLAALAVQAEEVHVAVRRQQRDDVREGDHAHAYRIVARRRELPVVPTSATQLRDQREQSKQQVSFFARLEVEKSD